MSSVVPRPLFARRDVSLLAFVSPDAGPIPPTLDSGTGYPSIATFLATGGIAPLAYTLILSDLPSGVLLDATSGVLSGIFPPNDFPPNELPTWVTPAGSLSGVFNEGNPVSVFLDANPAAGRTLDKFSVIYGILPFGVQLNTNTGEIFGTLADVGGGDTTQPNTPPVWTTPAGSLGSVLAENVIAPPISVSATPQGAASSVTYMICQGALPFGLQLDGATGQISGTPGPVVGLVEYPTGPIWTTPAGNLGTFSDGAAVSIPVSAAGAVSYTLVQGMLPPGVVFDATAQTLTGTNKNVTAPPTTYAFTLRATSSNGGWTDSTFSISQS